jgi:peroxiredoxin
MPQISTPLPAGTPAPPFDLPISPDQRLSLAACAGSPVVLIFYPADFSPVCSDELAIFGELQPELAGYGARTLGLSVDGVWCHRAFARERHLRFPLLSDFHPKGEVSRRYRAYREDAGVSERALYVLDGAGVVVWGDISPPEVNPGADGVLDALDRMSRSRPPAQEAHP